MVVTVTLNPPMGYDLTQTAVRRLSTSTSFLLSRTSASAWTASPKDTLQSVLPDEVRVDAVHFQFLKYLKDAEQEQPRPVGSQEIFRT